LDSSFIDSTCNFEAADRFQRICRFFLPEFSPATRVPSESFAPSQIKITQCDKKLLILRYSKSRIQLQVHPYGTPERSPLTFLSTLTVPDSQGNGNRGAVHTKETKVATCVISAAASDLIPARVETKKDDSERSLVQRAQQGDQEAFAMLFQLHKKRVYSVCLQMTKDVADAEDLTQEAFLQVFRNVNSFRGDSAFSTWLYRIAVNTVLMKLRRRKAPPLLSLDEPVSPESPSLKRDVGKADPSLSGAVDRIALRRAIEELPEGCRQIFDLHEVQGFQHHEIARQLQCSIGNSKSQLHKAKMKMRDLLFPKNGPARSAASATPSEDLVVG
jgi:RNA polymerase sigma-70 factor (ECF subfamily)